MPYPTNSCTCLVPSCMQTADFDVETAFQACFPSLNIKFGYDTFLYKNNLLSVPSPKFDSLFSIAHGCADHVSNFGKLQLWLEQQQQPQQEVQHAPQLLLPQQEEDQAPNSGQQSPTVIPPLHPPAQPQPHDEPGSSPATQAQPSSETVQNLTLPSEPTHTNPPASDVVMAPTSSFSACVRDLGGVTLNDADAHLPPHLRRAGTVPKPASSTAATGGGAKSTAAPPPAAVAPAVGAAAAVNSHQPVAASAHQPHGSLLREASQGVAGETESMDTDSQVQQRPDMPAPNAVISKVAGAPAHWHPIHFCNETLAQHQQASSALAVSAAERGSERRNGSRHSEREERGVDSQARPSGSKRHSRDELPGPENVSEIVSLHCDVTSAPAISSDT